MAYDNSFERGRHMPRDLTYYVREGCHGEWCVYQEQISPKGRFISRATTRADAERLVRELNAAVGMLKLDEPKKTEFGQDADLVGRLKSAIRDWQRDSPYVLEHHLNIAGLKIVEK